jgi:hypothetical protein
LTARTLTQIAEGLSQLVARRKGGTQMQHDATLAELKLLRDAVAARVRRGDPLSEGLMMIEGVLAEMERVLEGAGHAVRIEAVAVRGGLSLWLRRAALMVGAAAGGLSAAPALAADPVTPSYVGMTPQDIGVMQRARPEYDAKGIPFGGFRLFPTLAVSANYDDNVFRTPAASSDWYFEELPTLRLKSEWGRHFLEFYGGLDNYNYSTNSRLDLTDWTVGGDGRYDISRAADFSAAVSYGENHEPLSSPNTVGFQASPNRYDKAHVDAVGRLQPNRIGVSVGGSYDRYDWMNTPTIGGGFLSNDDRDETEYEGYVRASYDFSPGYSAFVKALYDSRQFDQFFDRSGLHRSSTGYRLDGGLSLQITHLVAGEIYVGYLEQNYAKNVPLPLTDVSGVDYGVNLDWFASPVLTVHLNGAHQVSDVTIAGVSASDDKLIRLSADYEFRRDIIVQGYVSYTNSTLTGSSRSDDYPGAGISVRYLMNRYMSADVNYNYSSRDSNAPGINYTDNIVSVGLSLHV